MQKKAIIFDLNGVFLQSPYLSDRFEKDFGVDKNDFLEVLKEVMAQVRLPNALNVYDCFEPYLEQWGITMTPDDFHRYWFPTEKENTELVETAQDLKAKGFRLFILSNNFKERATYYSETFSFLDELFDKVYYSWKTGYIKPDPKAFTLLLDEQVLQPNECLYFDNEQNNVDAASGLGIEAQLFTSDTKSLLQRLQ